MTNLQKISQRDLARTSILWFGSAFVLTLIPQLFLFLPIWVAIIFVICFIWRIQISRMKLSYPNGIVKFVIIAAVIGLLFMTKGNFLDTEGCTILFMSVYALKFVESKTIRDGYILACIGFIALATLYLFDNTAYIFAFSLLIFITLITAMIGLQQMGYGNYSRSKLFVKAITIMGISLPLTVILFIIFPRFPSMLPNMHRTQPEQQVQTGVSNRMEPGSIAELANSEAHILWAEFSDAVPPTQNLYWRSLTLDQFDGRAWGQSPKIQNQLTPAYTINSDIGEQDYSVVFDPSYQRYLATLDVTELNFDTVSRRNTILSYGDFRFEYNRPINSKIQYSGRYIPDARLLNRSDNPRVNNLDDFLVVTNNNPKTTELANQLLNNSASQEEFVNNLLTHFKQDGYQYSMEPGLLTSSNSIDEFMFDAKVGFCEHYASATAFMLRQAKIPSRIVIGYLGGAVDSAQKLVEVRAKDAHAWVEYWNDDKGWTRIDPTSAVSPNRVDLGIDELLNALNGRPTTSIWRQFNDAMTKYKDMIDYRWTKLVLGYQSQSQQSFLSQLFKINYMSVFTLVKISIILIVGFIAIQMIIFLKPWRRFYFDVNYEYFKIIELTNKRYQLNLPISTAPHELLERLEMYLPLVEREKLQALTDALIAHYYAPPSKNNKSQSLKKSLLDVQKILKSKGR